MVSLQYNMWMHAVAPASYMYSHSYYHSQSLTGLKLSLRVCAAFRGSYLDYKERADAWLKSEAKEQTIGRYMCIYMYMYTCMYIVYTCT